MRFARLTALTSAAVCVSLLAACSSSGGGSGASSTPATTSQSSSASTTTAATSSTSPGSASAAAGSTGGGDKITLNRSATDAAYGDKWTVIEVVRNAVTAPSNLSGLQGHELVAVKMTITSGTVFYAGLQTASFTLLPDTPIPNDGMETSDILTAQMSAAGLSPVLTDVETGKSATGWLLFNLETPGSKTLTLEYSQQAAQASDGTAVPAQKVDLKLIP